MRIFSATLALAALAAATYSHAAQHAPSPYAGEESREIKSLSADDIAELQRGGGWGLARPAELNGMPGPAHLLELKDEIPLSPEQVKEIEALYADMKQKAVAEGERLIALERELDSAFRTRTITPSGLQELLDRIERSRTALRFIHLSTHLQTPSLLRPEQIARYNALRGYAAGPCDSVPSGHDPALWRKHNGCQ